MIGTAATRIGGVQVANEGHATTPEAPDLQRALAAMVAAGDGAAVIETTSHGLALDRVDEIAYDVAILTNLTHEHLELPRDVGGVPRREAVACSSASRRTPRSRQGWPAAGIVNADDPSAGAFIGVAQEAGARGPDLRHGPGGRHPRDADRGGPPPAAHRVRGAVRAPPRVELQLVGRFNVHNALAVVALGEAIGLDPAAVRDGLAALDGRPGPDGADRPRPAVRRHRRLRPQPGVAPDRARPARARSRRRGAAASSRSSGRPANATPPSGRRWAGSPASAPGSWS